MSRQKYGWIYNPPESHGEDVGLASGPVTRGISGQKDGLLHDPTGSHADILVDPVKGSVTLLDPTTKLHARSRIPLDPLISRKSIAGSIILPGPTT